jgi:hypothetical protein
MKILKISDFGLSKKIDVEALKKKTMSESTGRH